MTGVDMRRTHTDHSQAALRLRAQPGRWGVVGPYRLSNSARSVASYIRTGALPAYQPAGSFHARWEANRDRTGWTVYGRYVGGAA